jgi:transcriptional regulator with XRE-family HTH domain
MPVKKGPLPFGKRVMRLRKEKNMTLKTLANETGLSSVYLSQLEKGEVIPPVAVILQLSRALEIDSSILLREEKAKAGKESDLDYRKRTEDYSYQTLTPEAAHKAESFQSVYRSQVGSQGRELPAPGRRIHLCAQGQDRRHGGREQEYPFPGECIHFNSSIIHKLRNISTEKAELLVVLYTP